MAPAVATDGPHELPATLRSHVRVAPAGSAAVIHKPPTMIANATLSWLRIRHPPLAVLDPSSSPTYLAVDTQEASHYPAGNNRLLFKELGRSRQRRLNKDLHLMCKGFPT